VGLRQASAEGVARFPFPPHGRIPNFADAEVTAARPPQHRAVEERHSHQGQSGFTARPLRAEALRRGITVFVPRPDRAAGAEARCGPNDSAMAMKTAPASARRFGIDGPRYSERITFQLRTSSFPPPALLTTGLPSVKCASSIASVHPAAIAFSRSASKSGRGA
jgi:5-formyltetrahydrofolate cyclo-ligase